MKRSDLGHLEGTQWIWATSAGCVNVALQPHSFCVSAYCGYLWDVFVWIVMYKQMYNGLYPVFNRQPFSARFGFHTFVTFSIKEVC